MDFFRKLFLFIFGVILFLLLFVLAVSYSLDSTVFNSEYVKKNLESQDLRWILDEVVEKIDVTSLSEEEQEKAVQEIMVFIKTYIPEVVDDLYNYLDGDLDKISTVIPLKDLKDKMRLLAYDDFKKKGNISERDFNEYWSKVEKNIPDEVNLAELLDVDREGDNLAKVRQGMMEFKKASASILTVTFIVALIMLIFSWSLQRFLKIAGGILIGVSILLIIISIGYFAGSSAITKILVDASGGDMNLSGIFDMVRGIFKSIGIFGLSYLGGGILCLVLGNIKIVSRNSEEEVE